MNDLFKLDYLEEGALINHERWNNISLEENYHTFKLFWTSLDKSSYYKNNNLMHLFKIKKKLKGISLLTSPDDLEEYIGKIPVYNLDNCGDAFKDMWYGILENNLLGCDIDFINLYNTEIIFSTKNLLNLKMICN
jgi:hypothetical protein